MMMLVWSTFLMASARVPSSDVGEVYDVALDDGSEELQCAAEELKREDGTEPSSYDADERVGRQAVPQLHGAKSACDGHRQVTHEEEMTPSPSPISRGCPCRLPLKLEVAMEAAAGVLDVSVEDKRGAKIRSCEVWLMGSHWGRKEV